LKDVKADYVILTSASPTRAIDVNRVLELSRDASLWHLDGRAAVIGPAKAA